MSEPEWMSHAACRGHWDEGDWDDLRPASQLLVCSTCPVLTQCRADVAQLTRRGCRPSGVVQAGISFPGIPSDRQPKIPPVKVQLKSRRESSPPPFDTSRETCLHGHPWTVENTKIRISGSNHHKAWTCITCENLRSRARNAGITFAQQLAIDALETA